jgi:hypothetical protein
MRIRHAWVSAKVVEAPARERPAKAAALSEEPGALPSAKPAPGRRHERSIDQEMIASSHRRSRR